MEDFPENFFETNLYLHKGEELESGKTQKSFTVSLSNEDENNFIIKVTDKEEEYILHLKYSDYINSVERSFTRNFNSFKLLFDKLKSSFENNKVVLVKTSNYSVKLIFYFKKKSLPFEIFPKDYETSQPIEEHLKINDREYKAELIKYEKNLEDYGDRYFVKCLIENVGTTTWDKEITSLICLPEYSSLICNEYFFEEEVIPNDRVEIELEFLKSEEQLKPPFFTFVYLRVQGVIFDPGLVLDFSDIFNEKNNIKPDFIKKSTEKREKTKIKKKGKEEKPKKNIIIDENKMKNEIKGKLNKIFEEKKNKNEIIEEKPRKNEIIEQKDDVKKKIEEDYVKKINNLKLKVNEEKKIMEDEIKKLKNENSNLKKEIDKQKNDVTKMQLENKQLKNEVKKITEDNEKQIKGDVKEKEELKKEIKNLKMKIAELEENIKKNKIKNQNSEKQDICENSSFKEKLDEIKKKYQEEMNEKYTNIINEKMKEIQKSILSDIKQENSKMLDIYLKQIEDLKGIKKGETENKIIAKEKIDNNKKKMFSYELLSDEKDLIKKIVEFEEEEICFELEIKNNGDEPWPKNGKARLIIDNNTEERIEDVELDGLKPNQVQNIKINFNVEDVESGEKNYTFYFNINGKFYGEPIVLKLNVEENEKVSQFRENFFLAKKDYSDRVLYDKLKEADFNMGEAFDNLF